MKTTTYRLFLLLGVLAAFTYLKSTGFAQVKTLNSVSSVNTPAALPTIDLVSNDHPSDGEFFLSNFGLPGVQTSSYLLLVNNGGQIVQSKALFPLGGTDFKIQPSGAITYFDVKKGRYLILDSNLSALSEIYATNGFTTDNHELIIAKDGHYFFLAKYGYTFDMSTLVSGGRKNANVLTNAIMEYDESGNEIMEWRTQDHFEFTDATHEDLTASTIDYCHTNSIDMDLDGNLLLSSRNMDEITKIDRATGNIIWRWGGKHNEFTFVGDSIGFSHQHCVKVLPNGHFLLFDNGNYHTPSFSRAVEYVLDQEKKTAELVWQYRHTPDEYAFAMGSVQRLDNGNTLIGWGSDTACTLTEVTPEGKTALEMKMQGISYRVFKFPWQTPQSAVRNSGEYTLNLSTYPNPASASTTFSYVLSDDGSPTLNVSDCLGRSLAHVQLGTQRKGDHTYALDLSHFARGVYLCSLEIDGKKTTSRLAVE